MRALFLTVLLMSLSFAVHAKTAEDWLKEGDDALKGVGKEIVDAADCIGKSPSGRIELLGVESDMGPSTQGTSPDGPSTQGMSPALKLGPNHPAMRALTELGLEMGLYYFDREHASAQEIAYHDAKSARRAQHDFYEEMLGLLSWGTSEANRITEAPGHEKFAKAHAEYKALAQQYASLYKAAEAAGRGCP